MILERPFDLENEAEVWAWVAELFDTPDHYEDGPVVETAYGRDGRFLNRDHRVDLARGLCTQVAQLVDQELITPPLFQRMLARVGAHMRLDGSACGYYFAERPERVLAALFLRLEVLDEARQG